MSLSPTGVSPYEDTQVTWPGSRGQVGTQVFSECVSGEGLAAPLALFPQKEGSLLFNSVTSLNGRSIFSHTESPCLSFFHY
jgi:hypothetical protein